MANPLGMTTAQRERQQEGVLDLLLSIEMNAFVSTSGGASGHCEVGCKGEEKGGLSDVDKQYLWDIQDTVQYSIGRVILTSGLQERDQNLGKVCE